MNNQDFYPRWRQSGIKKYAENYRQRVQGHPAPVMGAAIVLSAPALK